MLSPTLLQRKKPRFFFLLSLLLFTSSLAFAAKFPANFTWGASTSSYQIEGAWNVSGKGLDWNSWIALHDKIPFNSLKTE